MSDLRLRTGSDPRLRVGGIVLALALAAAAPGCAGWDAVVAMDRADDFDTAQQHFTQYVRFGNIAKAAGYVEEDQREEFLSLEPQLLGVRFTDYEVIDIDVDDDALTAKVDVRWSGYLQAEMVEKNVMTSQEWRFDDEEKEWMVTLEVAKIRRVLGGETN